MLTRNLRNHSIVPFPPIQSLLVYGKGNQAPMPTDDSPALDDAGKKRIQQIVGSFLYYARAVDPTILMALSDIACQSAKPTERTKQRIDQFLDYMWTHTDAKIRYRASDMVLNRLTAIRFWREQKLSLFFFPPTKESV